MNDHITPTIEKTQQQYQFLQENQPLQGDPENLEMNTNKDTNLNANTTTIQNLMSEQFYSSISNRLARPEENTTQEKHLTRLPGYNNIDQLCDTDSRPTGSQESWSHKELLYDRPALINQGYKVIPATCKEPHVLSRPYQVIPTHKEPHVLPATMPHNGHSITMQHTREKAQNLPQPPSASEAQKFRSTQVQQSRQEYSQLTETEKAKFLNSSISNDTRNFVWHNSVNRFSSTPVYMTKDTSSVSDYVFSEERKESIGDIPTLTGDTGDIPTLTGDAEDVSTPTGDIPAPAAVHLHTHRRQSRDNLTLLEPEDQVQETFLHL
ncbi:MAG: hypothetical protein MPK62_11190 [Alphaproteobacteria bacterium]|nr:hypothetical protein [Alphaproteobacteria bacterium]